MDDARFLWHDRLRWWFFRRAARPDAVTRAAIHEELGAIADRLK